MGIFKQQFILVILYSCVSRDVCCELLPDSSFCENFDTPDDISDADGVLHECSMGVRSFYADPIDYYKCQVCVCYNRTDDDVRADCRSSARHGMPLQLPSMTSHLELSDNRYRQLVYRNVSMYERLTHLNMSGNLINHLDNTSCPKTLPVRVLDLSGNRIVVMEDFALSCMPQLTYLHLKNNNITTLRNSTLRGVPGLNYLDLSYNRLKFIEYGAFDETPELKVLLLGHNTDLNYGRRVFNPRLFLPLQHLEVLSVQRFERSSGYPVHALLELSSLRSLQLDGIEVSISDVNLTMLGNLTTLKYGVDGFCWTTNISRSFFGGFPFLRSIHIQKCRLKELSPDAYEMNPLLEMINYTDINYPFDLLFSNLKSLNNSLIKTIIFNAITHRLNRDPCRALTEENSKYLTGLHLLTELYIENNAISLVTVKFILGLPRSLKLLSVKGNLLHRVRTLLHLPLDKGFVFMPNLTVLKEDMQAVGDFYRASPMLDDAFSTEQCIDRASAGSVVDRYSNNDSSVSYENYDYEEEDNDNISVPPTPKINLQYYTAVQSFHFGVTFMSGARKRIRFLYTVKYLNLSNTYRTNWGDITLKPWVQVVDFSNNFGLTLSNHFLEQNNSLRMLFASGNILGEDIAKDVKGEKLKLFTEASYLDLSKNHISSIPYLFFNGLCKGEVVILTDNNIVSLDVRLSHMSSLRFLDISRNSVSSISRRTMDDLDLLTANRTVYLDVSVNPLPCTCAGLEFIRWLATSNVRLIKRDFIVCLDESNRQEDMGDITARFEALQRHCASRGIVLVVSLFSFALLFVTLISALVFRKRWWIVYMKNVYLSKLYGFKPREGMTGANYAFDAYLIYAPENVKFVVTEVVEELERKRGHRLCIEDRDMIAGTFVPCNIVGAVVNSRMSIPLVTPEFESAQWAMYALRMSLMEAGRTKRELVHLISLEVTEETNLPRDILKLMKEGRFSEYPPLNCEDEVRKAFWDTLSQKIGKALN